MDADNQSESFPLTVAEEAALDLVVNHVLTLAEKQRRGESCDTSRTTQSKKSKSVK